MSNGCSRYHRRAKQIGHLLADIKRLEEDHQTATEATQALIAAKRAEIAELEALNTREVKK